MKMMCEEIFNFIGEISSRELRKNPRLKRKVKVLVRSIEEAQDQDELISNQRKKEILRYLNKEMLGVR